MKKIKYLFAFLLFLSIFTIPTKSFYVNHERSGEFLLLEKNNSNFTVYKANHLYVTLSEDNRAFINFTLDDGTILSTKKSTEEGSTYESLQIETIHPKQLKLDKECMAHTYPFEYKELQIGEMIQPGTYLVSKYTTGWYEVQNDQGQFVWIQPNKDIHYKIVDGEEQIGSYNYIPGKFATFIDSISTLSVDEVHGIPIYKHLMLDQFNAGVRSGYAMDVQYITIHNTAMSDIGDHALHLANIQYNRQSEENVWKSWHYQVDNISIYQSLPINESSWHAGDGMMSGNTSTISIEICENEDGNYAQAEINAAYLTAQLLFELGLPMDAIKMHKDWSNKNCPQNMIEFTKGSMGWEGFKEKVEECYAEVSKEYKENELKRKIYNFFDDLKEVFYGFAFSFIVLLLLMISSILKYKK